MISELVRFADESVTMLRFVEGAQRFLNLFNSDEG